MGREVKRVPVGFDWPLNKVWQGYLMPDELSLPTCPTCDGQGYSPRARELFNVWYGYVPFRPEANRSEPLTPDTPAVRAFAQRNVDHSPGFYGDGEQAVRREATRLATMWNGQWSHHVNADDVAALMEAGRLPDLTHTWTRGSGWKPIEPPVVPTPEQVNEWAILTMGHDAINASAVVRARCQREAVSELCDRCGGEGDIGTPEQRAAYEAWERSEPPTGEGWQLWETVSEGSPISPVLGTAEELARWMTANKCTVSGPMSSYGAALRFVREGWAPSLVGSPGQGVIAGTEWIGAGTP